MFWGVYNTVATYSHSLLNPDFSMRFSYIKPSSGILIDLSWTKPMIGLGLCRVAQKQKVKIPSIISRSSPLNSSRIYQWQYCMFDIKYRYDCQCLLVSSLPTFFFCVVNRCSLYSCWSRVVGRLDFQCNTRSRH